MSDDTRNVSRREFLRIAGATGAAVGLAGGLGGVLAACGGEEETTTTGASSTTSAPSTTATTAGSTTTVSAGPEVGREVKLGFVDPLTGNLAGFGIAGQYIAEKWRAAAGEGLVLGDGKKHPISIDVQDSQSDIQRAASVAGSLISDGKVDILMCAATGDTVNPVADQCEALGVPCLSTDVPMEVYVFQRGGAPDKPFKWTYNLFWGLTEQAAIEIDMFSQVTTNKKIGALWPNNAPGNAYRMMYGGEGQGWPDKSFTFVDSGLYNEPSEDFTQQISLFKKEGCEILQGVMIDPDWTILTKQCAQQGYKPVIMEGIKPTLFPATLEAIGPIGDGQCGTQWFHPTYPFKSSLTGETCQQLCDDFEAKMGRQWEQTIMHYVLFEWAVDVLKRTANLDDKQEIIKRVAETNMKDSVAGPFDFTAPVQWGTKHPVQNNVVTPTYGGQWRLTSGGTHQFELVVVSNAAAPQVAVADKLKPMSWPS